MPDDGASPAGAAALAARRRRGGGAARGRAAAGRRLGDRLQPARRRARLRRARAASSARSVEHPRRLGLVGRGARGPPAGATPPSASPSARSIAAASAKRSPGLALQRALGHDGRDRRRDAGVELVQRARRGRVLLAGEVGERRRLVGQAAREQLVGDDAERVEVGRRAGRLAARLLGREVGGRAEHGADLRDVRLLRGLGDAEVGELDLAARRVRAAGCRA